MSVVGLPTAVFSGVQQSLIKFKTHAATAAHDTISRTRNPPNVDRLVPGLPTGITLVVQSVTIRVHVQVTSSVVMNRIQK